MEEVKGMLEEVGEVMGRRKGALGRSGDGESIGDAGKIVVVGKVMDRRDVYPLSHGLSSLLSTVILPIHVSENSPPLFPRHSFLFSFMVALFFRGGVTLRDSTPTSPPP